MKHLISWFLIITIFVNFVNNFYIVYNYERTFQTNTTQNSFNNFDNESINNKLINVHSWVYQLQNTSIENLSKYCFDLVVIDYSKDGTEQNKYSKEEIEKLKNSGKIVLAYLSIGEAEDYRFYWNNSWYINSPEFLGKENPDWPGNYNVKYWNTKWKKIIFKYLDKIISQGFDGIYIDRVDAFEYWSDCNNTEDICLSEEIAAEEMIKFIFEIANYTRSKNPNFIIIIQNGENLIKYDKKLLNVIDGIAIEDLFYNGIEKNNNSLINKRLEYLLEFKRAGKLILVVDYIDTNNYFDKENLKRIQDFLDLCHQYGFIPYIALNDRELDEINIIPRIQPYC